MKKLRRMGVKGLPSIRQLVTKQPRMLEKEPSVSDCPSVSLSLSISCVFLSAPGSELLPILSRLYFLCVSLTLLHSLCHFLNFNNCSCLPPGPSLGPSSLPGFLLTPVRIEPARMHCTPQSTFRTPSHSDLPLLRPNRIIHCSPNSSCPGHLHSLAHSVPYVGNTPLLQFAKLLRGDLRFQGCFGGMGRVGREKGGVNDGVSPGSVVGMRSSTSSVSDFLLVLQGPDQMLPSSTSLSQFLFSLLAD